jgi:protein-disulfide isomerase
MIEAADFDCPFCRRYTKETFPLIDARYIATGKLKYAFMDMPLESLHPRAMQAAKAGRCAFAQDRFWEMHDYLLANQNAMGSDKTSGLANALGLDRRRFSTCMSQGTRDIVDSEVELRGLGLEGTPSFLIGHLQPDGKTVQVEATIFGAKPFSAFVAVIEPLLASTSAQGR